MSTVGAQLVATLGWVTVALGMATIIVATICLAAPRWAAAHLVRVAAATDRDATLAEADRLQTSYWPDCSGVSVTLAGSPNAEAFFLVVHAYGRERGRVEVPMKDDR